MTIGGAGVNTATCDNQSFFMADNKTNNEISSFRHEVSNSDKEVCSL